MSAQLADRRTAGNPDPAETITVTLGDKTFRAGRRTAAHLQDTIVRLAAQHPTAHLHVIQPCYNDGVEASAGTHDFDGVLDIRIDGLSWPNAERFCREQGWFAWWRHTGSWSSASQWHIHMGSLGCPGPVGIYVPGQEGDYYNHALGLSGQHHAGSDKSWHPSDISKTIFNYPKWLRQQEEQVPFTDWPKKDQDALAQAVAKAVVNTPVNEEKLTVKQALAQASNASGLVRKLAAGLKIPLK